MNNLNMFKSATSNKRSAETRSRILSTALATFRLHGLDSATMRQISKEAGVALGAAYYYFPSKEAIVQAFYDSVQEEHHQRVTAALSESPTAELEARLRIAFHTKLDILQGDRHLLGSLFRYTGEPEHPLSALGPGTRPNRDRSIAVFALAIGAEKLPDDIRALLPTALWALHMGILLYFIYDTSPNQERTRKLVDGVLSLVVRLLALVKFPLLKPFRGSLFALLRDAGLFPESPFPMPTSPASVVPQEE
jgi:AcrR family transcriptional regulator